MVVLQAGGHDLAGTGGHVLVDQHRHGEVGEGPLPEAVSVLRMRPSRPRVVTITPSCRNRSDRVWIEAAFPAIRPGCRGGPAPGREVPRVAGALPGVPQVGHRGFLAGRAAFRLGKAVQADIADVVGPGSMNFHEPSALRVSPDTVSSCTIRRTSLISTGVDCSGCRSSVRLVPGLPPDEGHGVVLGRCLRGPPLDLEDPGRRRGCPFRKAGGPDRAEDRHEVCGRDRVEAHPAKLLLTISSNPVVAGRAENRRNFSSNRASIPFMAPANKSASHKPVRSLAARRRPRYWPTCGRSDCFARPGRRSR